MKREQNHRRKLMTVLVSAALAASVLGGLAGCQSDEHVTNASGDKRTVRQAEPIRDLNSHPATVTGTPR